MPKVNSSPFDYPIVEVIWKDAAVKTGWCRVLDVTDKSGIVEIRTVGRMLRMTKDEVTVAPTVSVDGDTSHPWHIPRAWVQKIRKLK